MNIELELKDRHGKEIKIGSRIRLINDWKSHGMFITKPEYHFPEYIVEWSQKNLAISLRHVGGGKSGDSALFSLKYHSYKDIELVESVVNYEI